MNPNTCWLFVRLIIAGLLASMLPVATGQPPPRMAAGCEEGQILGAGQNAKLVICSATARQMPQVLTQLDRLNKIAAKNAEQQLLIERFVKQINAAVPLVSSRIDVLSQNVSLFLQKGEGRSDSQLIRDMESLSLQMEEIRERLDSVTRNPETASRARAALAGDVGDDLARLNFSKASQALDAIARLDKKIDELAVRIDCSSATPQAMTIAIKARAAERVLSIWRCRPENVVTPDVQMAFVLMFSARQFADSKEFFNELIKGGLNVLRDIKPLNGPLPSDPRNETRWRLSKYYYEPVYHAISNGNLEALEWIIANAPSGYWKGYTTLMSDITLIMRLPDSAISTSTAVRVISLLRQAGVPVESNDYKAFRDAYRGWLSTQLPDSLRVPLEPPNAMQRTMARQMGFSVTPRALKPGESELWKEISGALAPNSADKLKGAKSTALLELTGRDCDATNKTIEELTQQLSGRTWFRKIPETRATVEEAARRQAANVFDHYGYVQVAPGDLRDEDVISNQYYPNCGCLTVKDVRDRLSIATQRKAALQEFRLRHSVATE